MPSIFAISPLNSLRWVHQVPRDARYNTATFDNRRDDRCYRIKRQTNDIEPEQFLSSYSDIAIKFYTIDGLFYKDISVSQVDINIIDPTFEAYECDIDYSEFDEGEYFAELTYTDENSTVQTWQTAPISVADYWPETLLFEYFNSFNKNNVIFDTGIVFNQRVEAFLLNFDPSFNYNGFVDQEYDTTQLSSETYRVFALQLGDAHMLPDYMMDKANELMNVDNIKIDGTYYQKQVGDAKWQMSRIDGVPDAYGTIAIVQKDKPPEYNLDTGGDSDSNIIVVQKNEQYYNISGSVTIANKFKKYSHLTRIVIYNNGATAFDFRIGTTMGASDIGLIRIPADLVTDSFSISRAFKVATTLYVTFSDTALVDFFVDWKQYDQAPVNINGTNVASFIPGTVYEYYDRGIDGQFATDWNIGTGMGMAGTPFETCAMCDGRNGTPDLRDTVTAGFNYTNPTQRDATVGANSLTLLRTNLPNEGLEMFHGVNSGNGDTPGNLDEVARARNFGGGGGAADLNYEMSKATASAWVGRTNKMGDGTALDIRQKTWIMVKFICLS